MWSRRWSRPGPEARSALSSAAFISTYARRFVVFPPPGSDAALSQQPPVRVLQPVRCGGVRGLVCKHLSAVVSGGTTTIATPRNHGYPALIWGHGADPSLSAARSRMERTPETGRQRGFKITSAEHGRTERSWERRSEVEGKHGKVAVTDIWNASTHLSDKSDVTAFSRGRSTCAWGGEGRRVAARGSFHSGTLEFSSPSFLLLRHHNHACSRPVALTGVTPPPPCPLRLRL